MHSFRNHHIEVIQDALINENKREFLLGIFLFALGILSFFISFFSDYDILFKITTGFFFFCAIIVLLRAIKRFNVERNPFYIAVVYNSRNVVWVYHQVTHVMPFGIQLYKRFTIYIHTLHGKCYALQVSEKKLMPCLKYLEKLLPRATFGHDVNKEQLYRANPSMLMRD
jgi:hypothetical protein